MKKNQKDKIIDSKTNENQSKIAKPNLTNPQNKKQDQQRNKQTEAEKQKVVSNVAVSPQEKSLESSQILKSQNDSDHPIDHHQCFEGHDKEINESMQRVETHENSESQSIDEKMPLKSSINNELLGQNDQKKKSVEKPKQKPKSGKKEFNSTPSNEKPRDSKSGKKETGNNPSNESVGISNEDKKNQKKKNLKSSFSKKTQDKKLAKSQNPTNLQNTLKSQDMKANDHLNEQNDKPDQLNDKLSNAKTKNTDMTNESISQKEVIQNDSLNESQEESLKEENQSIHGIEIPQFQSPKVTKKKERRNQTNSDSIRTNSDMKTVNQTSNDNFNKTNELSKNGKMEHMKSWENLNEKDLHNTPQSKFKKVKKLDKNEQIDEDQQNQNERQKGLDGDNEFHKTPIKDDPIHKTPNSKKEIRVNGGLNSDKQKDSEKQLKIPTSPQIPQRTDHAFPNPINFKYHLFREEYFFGRKDSLRSFDDITYKVLPSTDQLNRANSMIFDVPKTTSLFDVDENNHKKPETRPLDNQSMLVSQSRLGMADKGSLIFSSEFNDKDYLKLPDHHRNSNLSRIISHRDIFDRKRMTGGSVFVPIESKVLDSQKAHDKTDTKTGENEMENTKNDRDQKVTKKESVFKPSKFNNDKIFQILRLQNRLDDKKESAKDFRFSPHAFKSLSVHLHKKLKISMEASNPYNDPFVELEKIKNTKINFFSIIGSDHMVVNMLIDNRIIFEDDRELFDEYFKEYDQGLYVFSVKNEYNIHVLVFVLLINEEEFSEDYVERKQLIRILKALSTLSKTNLIGIKKSEIENLIMDENPNHNNPKIDRKIPFQKFKLMIDLPKLATTSAMNPVIIGNGKNMSFYTKKTTLHKKESDFLSIVYRSPEEYEKFSKNYYVRIKDFNNLNQEFIDHFMKEKHKQSFSEIKRNLHSELKNALANEFKLDPKKFERQICKIIDFAILRLLNTYRHSELNEMKSYLISRNHIFEDYFSKIESGQVDFNCSELKQFYLSFEEAFHDYWTEDEKQTVRILATKMGMKSDSMEYVFGMTKKNAHEEIFKMTKKRSYKFENCDFKSNPQKQILLEDIQKELEYIGLQTNEIKPEGVLIKQLENMIYFLSDIANELIKKENLFEKLKKDFIKGIEKTIKKKLFQSCLKKILENKPQPKKIWITAVRPSKILNSFGVPEWEFIYERGDEFEGVKEYKVFSIEKEQKITEEMSKLKLEGEIEMLARRTHKFKLVEGESLVRMMAIPNSQCLLAVNLFKGSELRLVKKMENHPCLVEKLTDEILLADFNENNSLLTVLLQNQNGISYTLFRLNENNQFDKLTENVNFNEKMAKIEPKRIIQGMNYDFYVVDYKKEVFRFEHNSQNISKFSIISQKMKNILFFNDKNCLVLFSDNKTVPISLENGRALHDSKINYESDFKDGAIGDFDGKYFVFFVHKSKLNFCQMDVIMPNRKEGSKFMKMKNGKLNESISCDEFKSNGLLDYLPYLIPNPLRLENGEQGNLNKPILENESAGLSKEENQRHNRPIFAYYIFDVDGKDDKVENALKLKLKEIEENMEKERGVRPELSENPIIAYSGLDVSEQLSKSADSKSILETFQDLICLYKSKILETESGQIHLMKNELRQKIPIEEDFRNSALKIDLGLTERLIEITEGKQLKILSNVDSNDVETQNLFEEIFGSNFKGENQSNSEEKSSVYLSVKITENTVYLLIDFQNVKLKNTFENLLLAYINSSISNHTVFNLSERETNQNENGLDIYALAISEQKNSKKSFKELLGKLFNNRKEIDSETRNIEDLKQGLLDLKNHERFVDFQSILKHGDYSAHCLIFNEESECDLSKLALLIENINRHLKCSSQSHHHEIINIKETIARVIHEDFSDFCHSNLNEVLVFLNDHFDHYVKRGVIRPDRSFGTQKSLHKVLEVNDNQNNIVSFSDLPSSNLSDNDYKFTRFTVCHLNDQIVVNDDQVILGENYKGLNDLFDKVYIQNRTEYSNWEEMYKKFIQKSAENRLSKVSYWIDSNFEKVTGKNRKINDQIDQEKSNFRNKIDQVRRKYLIENFSEFPDFTDIINYQYVINSKPCHFVLCLDDSGSMRGKPWEELQHAVLGFVDSRENSEKEKLSIVQFNDEAEIMCEFINLTEFDMEKHLKFRSGGTNYGEAISKSHEVFLRNSIDNYRPIFIFMTDGRSETGEMEMQNLVEDLLPKKLITVTIMFNSQSLMPQLKKHLLRNSKKKQRRNSEEDDESHEQKKLEEQLIKLAQLANGKYLNSKDGVQLRTHFKQISSALDGSLRVTSRTKL